MLKKIAQITQLDFKEVAAGLQGVDFFARNFPIEPFLVFSEYRMTRPVFGPHPHAGISVMTYMFPDSKGTFINRDSFGDFSHIKPGGLHITQAGKGIQHDEFPSVTGVESHGLQIWINHTQKDRMVEPKALHSTVVEIPEIVTNDFKVRILHGTFSGIKAHQEMVTAVTLLHVFLKAHQSISIPASEMAFIYGLTGEGMIGDERFGGQVLVNFQEEGDEIILNAGENDLEFIFGSGTPINESIVYGGTYVMTTPDQMALTKRRYGKGEMGSLEPYQK